MADANTDPRKLKQDLWKKMADSPYVMVGPADGHAHHEPLTAQLDEDQVDTLFFFIGKTNRLAGGGRVMAQFVSKGHDFFACLDGDAHTDTGKAALELLSGGRPA